jgi:hypothetical protein
MHPEFARALAREHQEELLRHQEFRHRKKACTATHAYRATPVRRARRSLGRVLVVVGTRLLGGAPATVELFDTRR